MYVEGIIIFKKMGIVKGQKWKQDFYISIQVVKAYSFSFKPYEKKIKPKLLITSTDEQS